MVSGVGVLDPLVVCGGDAAYQLYLVHSPPWTLGISNSMAEIRVEIIRQLGEKIYASHQQVKESRQHNFLYVGKEESFKDLHQWNSDWLYLIKCQIGKWF